LTSVDCVSESAGRFPTHVAPVLPEVDVLFVNDYEAEQLTGIALGRAATLDRGAVERAARALIARGVRAWVVLHFPEGVCACSVRGEIVWQTSVRVPAASIAGTAGAGDALASGILLGLHEEWPMARALELGVCAAAASLRSPTCSDAVVTAGECLATGRALGFHALPA
jgi:sugar/nucleoside kinase (ribokinase family)